MDNLKCGVDFLCSDEKYLRCFLISIFVKRLQEYVKNDDKDI